jgi:hypothetical protein
MKKITLSAKNSGPLGRGDENLAKNTLPKVPVPTARINIFSYFPRGRKYTNGLYKGEVLHIPESMLLLLVSGIGAIDMHSVAS